MLDALIMASTMSLDVGKLANNTDRALPGYAYSLSGRVNLYGHFGLAAEYIRIGKSELAANAAITTASLSFTYGRLTLTAGELAKAVYAPDVWYSSEHPEIERIGYGKHYSNDPRYPSKACGWCGTTASVTYSLSKHVFIRGRYIGLVGLRPTFQGFMGSIGINY